MKAKRKTHNTFSPYGQIVLRHILGAFKAEDGEIDAQKAIHPGSWRLLQ